MYKYRWYQIAWMANSSSFVLHSFSHTHVNIRLSQLGPWWNVRIGCVCVCKWRRKWLIVLEVIFLRWQNVCRKWPEFIASGRLVLIQKYGINVFSAMCKRIHIITSGLHCCWWLTWWLLPLNQSIYQKKYWKHIIQRLPLIYSYSRLLEKLCSISYSSCWICSIGKWYGKYSCCCMHSTTGLVQYMINYQCFDRDKQLFHSNICRWKIGDSE